MHDYKKLNVWQDSVNFITDIYRVTNTFPDYEKFGIVSQLRRAAVSISSNIAEGAGRNTIGEFRNLLSNACGSICEVETQLIISTNLNYLNIEDLHSLTSKLKSIQKMTYRLMKSLNT